MKYQIEMLEPAIETALISLSRIATLKICRVTIVEIEDHSPALPIVDALLSKMVVRISDVAAFVPISPAAPFLESEPEKASESKTPANHSTSARSCANCGMVFDAWRKDQLYCSKPECQRAKTKKYQKTLLAKKADGNGDQPEIRAAEANPGPLAQN